MGRVAAIAIDAAEWWFVERLLGEGRLPNLAALRARGAECRLVGAPAYTSDQAWAQFLSGRDAAANRHWGLVRFDPATYEVSQTGSLRRPPFYARADETPTIAFDMPHSALAEDVTGLQVTAWGTHGPQHPRGSRPQGLLTEIDQRFGVHPGFETDFDTGWYHEGYIDALSERLLVGADRRIQIVRWLQERFPGWELTVTCMSEFHSAGHHFWHGVEPSHPLAGTPTAAVARERMVEIMVAVDTAIGELVASLPADTTVCVFALHGMGPAEDVLTLLALPELLHRLELGGRLLRHPDPEQWQRDGCPPLVTSSEEAWAVMKELRDAFVDTPKHRLREVLRRVLPPAAFAAVRRLAGQPPARHITELGHDYEPETDLSLDEIAAISKSLDWQPPAWYRANWPRMRAFALPSFDNGHIRINLEGRERDGRVPLRDYERTCDELIDELRACRNVRTGEPVVEDVVRVRADDPLAPDGPDADLVVRWTGAADAIAHPRAGIVGPYPYLRTGQHTRNGFAFIAGPGIEPGDLGEHDALDLTPTIVELLGATPDPDLPGRSLLPGLGSPLTRT